MKQFLKRKNINETIYRKEKFSWDYFIKMGNISENIYGKQVFLKYLKNGEYLCKQCKWINNID